MAMTDEQLAQALRRLAEAGEMNEDARVAMGAFMRANLPGSGQDFAERLVEYLLTAGFSRPIEGATASDLTAELQGIHDRLNRHLQG